jgi:hypothetical protein
MFDLVKYELLSVCGTHLLFNFGKGLECHLVVLEVYS